MCYISYSSVPVSIKIGKKKDPSGIIGGSEQIPAVDLLDINTFHLNLFPVQQAEAQPYVSEPPPPQIVYSFFSFLKLLD